MNEPWFSVASLSCAAGGFRLQDINVHCARGEYHVLLGPTGSGKSTLIRCLLGLQQQSSGSIQLGSRSLADVPAEERGLGYLPQNYALFPHLDVEENIRFGLGPRSRSSGEAARLIEKFCDLLRIDPLRRRPVAGLSGGERQKVALARALVASPEVLLLDEPFSAIDEGTRRALWFELRQVIREAGVTAIHITHHLEEAYSLGDRVSLLFDGRLAQSGTREQVFERPAGERIARFLGYHNIFTGDVAAGAGGPELPTGHFAIRLPGTYAAGTPVTACIRPQDLKILREGETVRDTLRENIFSGTVTALFRLPEYCLMRFQVDGSPRTYDFELKFPDYIRQRYTIEAGNRLRIAAWQPHIIVWQG